MIPQLISIRRRCVLLQLPLATLLFSWMAILFSSPPLRAALQMDRMTLVQHPWTIATSQWTHWSADHLMWDLLVFVVLGATCERNSRRRFIATVIAASLVVPCGVIHFAPDVVLFRGLSGIDSALFGLLIAQTFRAALHERDPLMIAVTVAGAAAFACKTGFELLTGAPVFVSANAQFLVVPAAHLSGAALGLGMGMVSLARKSLASTVGRSTGGEIHESNVITRAAT